MDNLLSYLYLFIKKAVWITALILIIMLVSKPITAIINNPDIFSHGNIDCLYYLVWIFTVISGIYFIASIISNILDFSEPTHSLNEIESEKRVDSSSCE